LPVPPLVISPWDIVGSPKEQRMAKYTNTELMLEGPPTFDGELELISRSKSKVVFQDSDSGDTIIYSGHDLVVKKNIIISGDLTGWTFANSDQDPYTVINGFKIDLDRIDAKNSSAFADKVYAKMLSGNDTFTGSSAAEVLIGLKGNDTMNGGGGNDVIQGGKGNDALTGGGGLDGFYFAMGDGKDTVSDFNADDMNLVEHDYIGAKFEDVTVSATGTGGVDTLIDFGGGSTITLLGVLSTDISANDFFVAS
jgi:Ca2+-binding RTX toxin-like protein